MEGISLCEGKGEGKKNWKKEKTLNCLKTKVGGLILFFSTIHTLSFLPCFCAPSLPLPTANVANPTPRKTGTLFSSLSSISTQMLDAIQSNCIKKPKIKKKTKWVTNVSVKAFLIQFLRVASSSCVQRQRRLLPELFFWNNAPSTTPWERQAQTPVLHSPPNDVPQTTPHQQLTSHHSSIPTHHATQTTHTHHVRAFRLNKHQLQSFALLPN